jgi:protein SCO1/2
MKPLAALAAMLLFIVQPCEAALTQRQLESVELAPPPGATLPLDVTFTEAENDKRLSLVEALDGKPALLILAGYTCQFICGSALAIAAAGLSDSGLKPGEDFQLLVIGIDPKDGVDAARSMKKQRLDSYGGLAKSAKFLVGGAPEIGRVTKALGYSAVYDRSIGQFAHPVGAFVIASDGHVFRTISGLALDGPTLRAALAEAKAGQASGLANGVRLLCYGFGPIFGANAPVIQTAFIAASFLTAFALFAFVGHSLWRERRGKRTI